MWRISNDIWDGWNFTHTKPGDDFPNGVATAFDNLARWVPYAKPGNWPDADMLPWGSLRPNPGWGAARQSRLTHDEQQTQFVLWTIARSPLILGANLTQLDEFTRSLVTNRDLIEVNQKGSSSHPWTTCRPAPEYSCVAHNRRNRPGRCNLQSRRQPAAIEATWAQLGVAAGTHTARNLLDGGMSAASPTSI